MWNHQILALKSSYFTIFDAVVNEYATKKYHWLKEEKESCCTCERILANIRAVLCTTTTWNHQIWSFDDNASAQMQNLHSTFLLWNRSYQFLLGYFAHILRWRFRWRWRKRHLKISLCFIISLFRLFYLGHILQFGRSIEIINWYEQLQSENK